MKVWRKNTVRWFINGKRVSPKTKGAKKITEASKRWYGTLRTFDGKRRQVPLCEDRQAAEAMLRRLQTEADHKRAVGFTREDEQRERPLSELLTDYETHLRSKGNTENYVAKTILRIQAVVNATKAKTLADVDTGRISATLAAWRGRKRKSLNIATTNHYARAVKSFTRWLWTEHRTHEDPLTNLRLLNAKADRRHVRRAFNADELQRLVSTTETCRKTLCGIRGVDRAMLYRVAAYTGLRLSELCSLTVASFDLEAKTLTVAAAYSKHRRNDVLPLHASLVERLRPWLTTKTTTLWTIHGRYWGTRAAEMIRRDLKRAEIAYVDDQGRVVDFHALRHTFITQLARAGVHPAKAKELARHSTITLTMDVYSHVDANELRDALDSVPGLL
jgi:site-specific recombinase XerD